MRLDANSDIGVLMRARAVYLVCFAFVCTQILNLIFMSYTYKAFTLDHAVSLVACFATILITITLRYTKHFGLIAGFYSLLLILGVAMSSVPDGTGIHSALLPLLIAGVIMNGFISGWRMVWIYTISALVFVSYLFTVSIDAPMIAMGGTGDYAQRTFQRAMQTALALTLCASIVGLFSVNMYKLFKMLEDTAAKAQRADMAKSQFLANMSHELRTPLNGVIGMTQLLLKTPLDDTQRNYAQIVNSCSAGLVTIINDVLDLSKLDAGKVEIKFEPFNLRDLVVSLLHLHQPAAVEKGLKLYLDYDADLPTNFIGDESRLRQIINNLIGNGVKFTDQGHVSVFVKGAFLPEGNFQLTFYVQDTGIGIPQADLGRIFDRFEQVDNRLSSNSVGTGLGLAISSEMVGLMGGTMQIDSVLGQGTTFYFSLEMIVRDAPVLPAQEDAPPQLKLRA